MAALSTTRLTRISLLIITMNMTRMTTRLLNPINDPNINYHAAEIIYEIKFADFGFMEIKAWTKL